MWNSPLKRAMLNLQTNEFHPALLVSVYLLHNWKPTVETSFRGFLLRHHWYLMNLNVSTFGAVIVNQFLCKLRHKEMLIYKVLEPIITQLAKSNKCVTMSMESYFTVLINLSSLSLDKRNLPIYRGAGYWSNWAIHPDGRTRSHGCRYQWNGCQSPTGRAGLKYCE